MVSKAKKAQSYCLKVGIHIYPVPQDDGSFKIVISQRGKKPMTDPNTYNKDKWAQKIWNYYMYYYNKYLENVVSDKSIDKS